MRVLIIFVKYVKDHLWCLPHAQQSCASWGFFWLFFYISIFQTGFQFSTIYESIDFLYDSKDIGLETEYPIFPELFRPKPKVQLSFNKIDRISPPHFCKTCFGTKEC